MAPVATSVVATLSATFEVMDRGVREFKDRRAPIAVEDSLKVAYHNFASGEVVCETREGLCWSNTVAVDSALLSCDV
jgi:hypothetical protein